MTEYITRTSVTGEDIRNLRKTLELTQKELAVFLRCSRRTVEKWESEAEKITGPMVPLLEILMRHPEKVREMEVPPRTTNLRLWYYYENLVCTIMDVDEIRRTVRIRNYVSNPLMRAFGVNTEPTFEEYEEFLASRCFPETRDKIKLYLKELDLPFYDPLMIIEKTEGKMAEDHFWVRVERGDAV